jgi:threonine dehydrogenase-like Zn-dependent dehydrogenase
MCRNGSQLWTVEPDYAVRLDPRLERVGVLMEPTTVVAKAWEQVELVGNRSWFAPARVLIMGAGPIGLLAALLGVQRGLEVHVLDLPSDGPKPQAVEALGAQYHHDGIAQITTRAQPDIIIEATGVSSLVFDAMRGTAPYGIVCLTGVSPAGRRISVDIGAANRELVLENDVVVGSVNANPRHYAAAADALAKADLNWLERLITRRVPLDRFADALTGQPNDIKVVLDLT